MSNIDAMTADQLRDALAVAAGWRKCRNNRQNWHSGPNAAPPFCEDNTDDDFDCAGGTATRIGHPIPPLDSPDALGVVAGMMPAGYFSVTFLSSRWTAEWSAVWKGMYTRPDVSAYGNSEAAARAGLVLKVLAATRKEGSAVMDCLVDGCDCQDDKGKT